jgi:aspartate aminotransferase
MLEMLQRSEVSNPPGFGAKIASQVLRSEELKKMWYTDMITMSDRIRSMRKALYDHLLALETPGSWDHLIRQSGMFGFLGLSAEVVVQLRGMSESLDIKVPVRKDENANPRYCRAISCLHGR